VTTSAALIALIHAVGPHICVLKTHIDILTDASPQLYTELRRLSAHYNFILFEDRKFADIGHTVSLQYAKV
jgi:orotidine-5'-phosphate decarboxylase